MDSGVRFRNPDVHIEFEEQNGFQGIQKGFERMEGGEVPVSLKRTLEDNRNG